MSQLVAGIGQFVHVLIFSALECMRQYEANYFEVFARVTNSLFKFIAFSLESDVMHIILSVFPALWALASFRDK